MTDQEAMRSILERGYCMTIAEGEGFATIVTSNGKTFIRTVAGLPFKGHECQTILDVILNDQKDH